MKDSKFLIVPGGGKPFEVATALLAEIYARKYDADRKGFVLRQTLSGTWETVTVRKDGTVR